VPGQQACNPSASCKSVVRGRTNICDRFGTDERGGSDGNRTRVDLIDSEVTSPDVSRASKHGGTEQKASGARHAIELGVGRRPIIGYSIVKESPCVPIRSEVSALVTCSCPIGDTEFRAPEMSCLFGRTAAYEQRAGLGRDDVWVWQRFNRSARKPGELAGRRGWGGGGAEENRDRQGALQETSKTPETEKATWGSPGWPSTRWNYSS
jgi:hypothetical protein